MQILDEIEFTIRDAEIGIPGLSSLLLYGEPGVGKTFLAEAIQKIWGAKTSLFFQLYNGVEKEKLLMDINVPNLVKSMQIDYQELENVLKRVFNKVQMNDKDYFFKTLKEIIIIEKLEDRIKAFASFKKEFDQKEKTYIKTSQKDVILNGILYQAMEESHKGKTIVIFDEIDKADEEIDILFLDFLQNARLTDPSFGKKYANKHNLIPIFTSNEQRDLNPAFRRRPRNVRMQYPTVEQQYEIIEINAEDIVKRLGRNRIINIISISEQYRKQNPVVKSNPYSLYRCINDIDVIIKKQDPEKIINRFETWFTNKPEDKELIRKLKIKNKSLKKFIESNIL